MFHPITDSCPSLLSAFSSISVLKQQSSMVWFMLWMALMEKTIWCVSLSLSLWRIILFLPPLFTHAKSCVLSKHLLLLICNMWNCFAIHKENLQSYSCSNTNAICVLCLLAFPGAAAFFDSMQDVRCMLKTLCLRFFTHSIHGSMCKKTFPQIFLRNDWFLLLWGCSSQIQQCIITNKISLVAIYRLKTAKVMIVKINWLVQ